MKTEFSKQNIFTKKDCGDCWARFFCAGGCNANNMLYNGNMKEPLEISCALEKKRLECALMIKAALSEAENNC
jgi:radical SAM additional 4Fe4S-binding domain